MLLVEKEAGLRRADNEAEFERHVDAFATGYAVARSEKAHAAWERRRQARHGTPIQSVDAYRATVSRLAGLTSRGAGLGLVKVH